MTPTSPLQTVVRSDADLAALWAVLMGDEGFTRRSLWLLFIEDDGRPAPVVVPIDDIPAQPDPELCRGLAGVVAGLKDRVGLGSVAALLSRPGDSAMCENDRRWARQLVQLSGLSRRWPVHLATADRVQVFAADDLLESASG